MRSFDYNASSTEIPDRSAYLIFTLVLLALLLGLWAPDPAHGATTIPIRNLAADTAPASGDMLIVDKAASLTTRKLTLATLSSYLQTLGIFPSPGLTITCTAPLRCAGGSSHDLSSNFTLSVSDASTSSSGVSILAATSSDTTSGHVVQASDPRLPPSPSTDDTLLLANGTTWQAKAVPNCLDSSGNHLNYTASTNAFSCGTSGGGGGGVTSLAGTTNQVVVSGSTGAVTISIPTSPTLPGTTTGTFSGNIAGDVTGNVTGSVTGSLVGNASTATALAANGSNCSAGSFPLGVSTSGASESCTALPTTIAGTTNQITVSAATGSITISIPTNPTLPGTTAGTFNGSLTGNVTGNITGNVTGNSTTATALAANGTNCSAGSFPLGVDASGTAETCTALPTTLAGTTNQIAVNGSTGSITISIPTSPTLPGTTTGTFAGNLTGNITGNVTGNASTATALVANGANCSAGAYARGVDTLGNSEACTADNGENNTASNVGIAGVGIFDGKTGIDLAFRKLNPVSSKVTITLDSGNQKIDIDVPDASTSVKGAVQLATDGNTSAGLAVQGSDSRLARDYQAPKNNSEAVANSITLQDDDELFFSSVPIGKYKIEIIAGVHLGNATHGFQSAVGGTAIFTSAIFIEEAWDGLGSPVSGVATGTGGVLLSDAGDTNFSVRIDGNIDVTTGGTLGWKWAQAVAGASNTQVLVTSSITLHRLN